MAKKQPGPPAAFADFDKLQSGQLGARFGSAITDAWSDVEARPTVKAPRVVTVKVTVAPVVDQDGVFQHANMAVDLSTKLPAFSTGAVPVKFDNAAGQLALFSDGDMGTSDVNPGSG